jgi:hypothetical protein
MPMLKYRNRGISDDILTGIQKPAESKVKIFTNKGIIQATFDGEAQIKLYSITEQLLGEAVSKNGYEQTLKQDIYIYPFKINRIKSL